MKMCHTQEHSMSTRRRYPYANTLASTQISRMTLALVQSYIQFKLTHHFYVNYKMQIQFIMYFTNAYSRL